MISLPTRVRVERGMTLKGDGDAFGDEIAERKATVLFRARGSCWHASSDFFDVDVDRFVEVRDVLLGLLEAWAIAARIFVSGMTCFWPVEIR